MVPVKTYIFLILGAYVAVIFKHYFSRFVNIDEIIFSLGYQEKVPFLSSEIYMNFKMVIYFMIIGLLIRIIFTIYWNRYKNIEKHKEVVVSYFMCFIYVIFYDFICLMIIFSIIWFSLLILH